MLEDFVFLSLEKNDSELALACQHGNCPLVVKIKKICPFLEDGEEPPCQKITPENWRAVRDSFEIVDITSRDNDEMDNQHS